MSKMDILTSGINLRGKHKPRRKTQILEPVISLNRVLGHLIMNNLSLMM